MKITESFSDVRGCKVLVRKGGKGQPMLFLHGANGPSVSAPFLERLADNFEVFAPDHPGFGASDTPEWVENIADMAYFYLDFLRAQNLRDVHIVGNSLGGWIAAEMAVRATDRIKTITLASAVGLYVEGVERPDIFLMSPGDLTRALFADPEFARKWSEQPLTDEESTIRLKNRFMTAKLSWQPRSHNPELPKWLHRIDVPTLILWGDNDQILPLPFGEAYQKLIPASRMHVLKNCGHLPQVEKPNEFVTHITEFAAAA